MTSQYSPSADAERASDEDRPAASARPPTEASDEDLPTLSVVVIARNEEDRIGDCLESVLEATAPFEAEIVVVDSNSTDRTVPRAADYPASVYRIPTDDLSTPSAGRYVGGEAASGEQVLFVDGDIVVSRGWLRTASRTLDADPDLAGVDGHLGELDDTFGDPEEAEAVEYLRGVALYDADALSEVGGFDPFLRSLEDLHLGFELTAEGYRLLRLPVVTGEQVREASGYREPLRRWRRGFFHGVADALFRSASSPRLLAKHLREVRYAVVAGGWYLVGLASLVAPPAFAVWLGVSVLGAVALARTQGVERAYKLLTFWTLMWTAVLTHEWRAPRERESYPLERVETVAEGPRLG